MKFYQYQSPIGCFKIVAQANGRWGLWFKDDLLGSYSSAVAAADDVYTQATGNSRWDSLKGISIPTDVYEWEVITR
jgi:hypothetical protein